MNILKMQIPLLLLILSICVSTSVAQTQQMATRMAAANALLQSQKWDEAVKAYEAITVDEPNNGLAWFQLAWARHGLGQYQAALDALQKPLQLSKGTPREAAVLYASATMYAGMKDMEKAFEWLNKTLATRASQLQGLKNDPNFVGLRGDRRFKELSEAGAKAAKVCMNIPEYRGFDFWVGDWNVVGQAGQQLGTNKVVVLADGCIVEENWESAGGGVGKSFNFYNPTTKKWHQSYMDNTGGNWMMDGELRDGVLRYEGTIYSPTGKVLVHMTFYNMGPDKVRQTAETSTDDGKTWTSVWDGMYVRKK